MDYIVPWSGRNRRMSADRFASAPAYRRDRILIKPKAGISPAALASFHAARKSAVLRTYAGIGGLQTLQYPKERLRLDWSQSTKTAV